MGAESKTLGVHVLLGPVAGPLGKIPTGGRNWEGFSPDPYLTGIAMAQTIEGMQEAGVQACAKHFIGNEQERGREQMSSAMPDRVMHELYLWPFADAVKANVASFMCRLVSCQAMRSGISNCDIATTRSMEHMLARMAVS
jgi:beta-glucosidase